MKRNYINEIAQIKERNGVVAQLQLRFRLLDLKNQFEYLLAIKDDKINKFELAKYFPIAVVASGDIFFRTISQSLIDKGEPYSINAGKFNQKQNIKFDFEIVHAIHGKLVTIGEIISHMLSFNDPNDIAANISTILDKDLISELKKIKKKSKIIEDYNQAVDNFIVHHQVILADVKRLYELRHIFCHEFGTSLTTDIDEIYKVFCNTIIFYVVCEWYLQNELYPDSPETSTDMIKIAAQLYEKSENELEDVINMIREKSDSSQNEFEELIKKWKDYMAAYSKYQSSLFDFGTLQPLLEITEKAILTDDFKDSLSKHPKLNKKKI